MSTLIKISALVCLVFHSLPSSAQTESALSNNFLYQSSNIGVSATFGALENKFLNGNYIGIKGAVRQNKKINEGIFVGGEGFVSKSDFTVNDDLINNIGKTIVGGFGLSLGLLKANLDIMTDMKLNFGMTHVSQNINFTYIDRYEYFKYEQVQNDWLTYIETVLDFNRNVDANSFSRLIVGMRYEYPLQSRAKASVNGMKVIISPGNRKSHQIWAELGILRVLIHKSWAISTNLLGGYKHLSQNILDVYHLGGGLSIQNKRATVLWMGVFEEFNSTTKTTPTKSFRLSVDFINF